MRVRVHFNLHRHDWSVTAIEGPERGRVIEHTGSCALTGCTFKVSEAARERVLRTRQRAVHAWVEGERSNAPLPADAIEFTYNPYRAGTFTLRSGEPITRAESAWFVGRKAFVGGAQ